MEKLEYGMRLPKGESHFFCVPPRFVSYTCPRTYFFFPLVFAASLSRRYSIARRQNYVLDRWFVVWIILGFELATYFGIKRSNRFAHLDDVHETTVVVFFIFLSCGTTSDTSSSKMANV
jgi:hypothetical protein